MALTRDFKETVRARVQRDPAFRRELLREGLEALLNGHVETGKMVLGDYMHATVGLRVGQGHAPLGQSLMRMLGPQGNPQAQNLFEIVSDLLHHEGIHFELRAAGAR